MQSQLDYSRNAQCMHFQVKIVKHAPDFHVETVDSGCRSFKIPDNPPQAKKTVGDDLIRGRLRV